MKPLLLLLVIPVLANSQMLPSEILNEGRLPAWVRPDHYALEVQPYLTMGNFTYDGSVRITLAALASTDVLYVHSVIEKIKSVITGPDVAVTGSKLIPKYDLLEINLDKKLTPGNNYTLTIQYIGNLKANKASGFYLTTIQGAKRKYGAATTLEPMSARMAYPCLDEPSLKARMEVTVIREEGMVALSNMPLHKSTPLKGGNWVKDQFQTTPPMSTYLLAIVVGEYIGIKNEQYGVWASPAQAKRAQYALSLVPVMLEKYGKLLQSPYPLPKMDLIGVEPFLSGAMENWGLVVYSEKNLYHDSNSGKNPLVDMITAHELAHQWFGNLVTLDWWDQLYLNEGFATFFQYVGELFLDPSLDQDMKIVQDVQAHMYQVEDQNPTAVVIPIKQRKGSMSRFGSGVYLKATCLIRMLLYHVGVDEFVQGIRSYIKANQYGNVNSKKLYSHFNKSNTNDLDAMMETWLTQTGYPTIKVTRNYKNRTATISQQSPNNQLYHIPITYTDQRSQDYRATTKLVLTTEKAILTDMPGEDEWLLLNIHEAGYYKVEYDSKNLQLLRSQLQSNPEVLPSINRVTLQNGLTSTGMKTAEEVNSYLEMSQSLPLDQTVPRWYAYLTTAAHVHDLMEPYNNTDWQNYMKELIEPLYQQVKENSLNLKGDRALKREMSEDIVVLACHLGLSDCLDLSQKYYQSYVKSGDLSEVPESYQFQALCKKDRVLVTIVKIGKKALKYGCNGERVSAQSLIHNESKPVVSLPASSNISMKKLRKLLPKNPSTNTSAVLSDPNWDRDVIAEGVSTFLKKRSSSRAQMSSRRKAAYKKENKNINADKHTLMKQLLKYAV